MNRTTTILLADDDDGHSMLILKGLREVGITQKIICFRNGQEVLDFLGEGSGVGELDPSGQYVLLLDIRMPMADGSEVLLKIRQSEKLKDMPVIMLTTSYCPEEIASFHNLGCNAFMVKSVRTRDFFRTIQSLGNFLQDAEIPKLRGFTYSGN